MTLAICALSAVLEGQSNLWFANTDGLAGSEQELINQIQHLNQHPFGMEISADKTNKLMTKNSEGIQEKTEISGQCL